MERSDILFWKWSALNVFTPGWLRSGSDLRLKGAAKVRGKVHKRDVRPYCETILYGLGTET